MIFSPSYGPMCVGCKMHLAKYCCQHLKKVERIFNAPLTKVKCKGVVKLSASSVNYKGIIATHSIGGGLALATMHKDAFRVSRLVMIGYTDYGQLMKAKIATVPTHEEINIFIKQDKTF